MTPWSVEMSPGKKSNASGGMGDSFLQLQVDISPVEKMYSGIN